MASEDNPLFIHLTNVTGIGATKLVGSLLPCMEKSELANIVGIFLPGKGVLADYKPIKEDTVTLRYKRFLPNGISRVLECLFFSSLVMQGKPILVLGDIPLRLKGKQAVFVQTSHLIKQSISGNIFSKIKHFILRMIFKLNLRYADLFIVQTNVMRDRLIENYPMISGKVLVISQPAPSWVLNAREINNSRQYLGENSLRLIYPAANYPHKNHRLLKDIETHDDLYWPIDFFKITIDAKHSPTKSLKWIKCIGELSESEICEAYFEADGLVFLSLEESYGLPIVEAMYLGLPIVCPSLAYAEVLCGDEAIYFDPTDIRSLNAAILELERRLKIGWQPNWNDALNKIPKNWDEVADKILVAINSKLR